MPYIVLMFRSFSVFHVRLNYTVLFFSTAGDVLPTTIAVSGLKYSRHVNTQ